MVTLQQAKTHYNEQFDSERIAHGEKLIDEAILAGWAPGKEVLALLQPLTTAREIEHLRCQYREQGWMTRIESDPPCHEPRRILFTLFAPQ